MTSENGAMIGIVSAAFAEPEGMMILMSVCIAYITPTDTTRPVPLISPASACSIGSMIRPSCNTSMIPPANPTTSAVDSISFAPSRKSRIIPSVSSPAAYPDRMPIARNIPEISGRYHPCPNTPMTRNTTVNASTDRIKKWNDRRNPAQPDSTNSPVHTGTAGTLAEKCPTDRSVTG